jgi:hypothetical protein
MPSHRRSSCSRGPAGSAAGASWNAHTTAASTPCTTPEEGGLGRPHHCINGRGARQDDAKQSGKCRGAHAWRKLIDSRNKAMSWGMGTISSIRRCYLSDRGVSGRQHTAAGAGTPQQVRKLPQRTLPPSALRVVREVQVALCDHHVPISTTAMAWSLSGCAVHAACCCAAQQAGACGTRRSMRMLGMLAAGSLCSRVCKRVELQAATSCSPSACVICSARARTAAQASASGACAGAGSDSQARSSASNSARSWMQHQEIYASCIPETVAQVEGRGQVQNILFELRLQ